MRSPPAATSWRPGPGRPGGSRRRSCRCSVPAPAGRQALARAELRLDQIGVVEVNEAFAAQYLAVEKELGLDRERVNPNGGAIALGHPIGASGARLLLTLLYELRHRGERYGLAALCIGGGQGIAAVVEAA